MTVPEALLAFAFAAGLLTLTPGLDTALVLRTATVEGSRQACLAALGIVSGCLTWGIVVALGLGALLAASEFAYSVLRWAGAGYLLYLGGTMVLKPRHGFQRQVDAAGLPAPGRTGAWYLRGLLTNLLNPKIGVFYVTFLPQFVPAGAAVATFTVLLAAIHAVEGVLWLFALVLATRPLTRFLQRPVVVTTLDRLTGLVLVAAGLRLLLDARR